MPRPKPDYEFLQLLFRDLPDLLLRSESLEWSKGLIAPATLKGWKPGPPYYVIGGKSVYKKKELFDFLCKFYNVTIPEENDNV